MRTVVSHTLRHLHALGLVSDSFVVSYLLYAEHYVLLRWTAPTATRDESAEENAADSGEFLIMGRPVDCKEVMMHMRQDK